MAVQLFSSDILNDWHWEVSILESKRQQQLAYLSIMDVTQAVADPGQRRSPLADSLYRTRHVVSPMATGYSSVLEHQNVVS